MSESVLPIYLWLFSIASEIAPEDGSSDGFCVGFAVGTEVCSDVVLGVGVEVGVSVGLGAGVEAGASVGFAVGFGVGSAVGSGVVSGCCVEDGASVDSAVSFAVGSGVGVFVIIGVSLFFASEILLSGIIITLTTNNAKQIANNTKYFFIGLFFIMAIIKATTSAPIPTKLAKSKIIEIVSIASLSFQKQITLTYYRVSL